MAGDPNDQEGHDERLNRELIELLNELRVVLPGVQVLFAFLLVVPFSQRFPEITNGQRQVFFATFISTALATGFLIAPSTYHRLRWRQHDKEQMLQTANRFSIAGTAFLALALTGAVYLLTDLIFRATTTAVTTAAAAAFLGWFWYGLPLLRRLRDGEEDSGV